MPVLIPEWFLCCQQKQSVYNAVCIKTETRFHRLNLSNSQAKHLETILSALFTLQNARSKVRVHQWVSTYRVQGFSWDTEIWSNAIISSIRTIYIHALREDSSKQQPSGLQLHTHRGLERVIQGIKEETLLYRKGFAKRPAQLLEKMCIVGWTLLGNILSAKLQSHSANERSEDFGVLRSAL